MNRGFTYSEVIGGKGEGRELLAYLSERYAHSGEAAWRERIAEGRVLVDGRPGLPGERLRRGQTLDWKRPPWEEPPAPLDWTLLHEDPELLAVRKPSGLPTLPGGGFLEHSLLHQVRRRYPEASPVHRLGRGTSGIVLFARTQEAASLVGKALLSRDVTKVYRALVQGRPEKDRFDVTAPIGLMPHPLLGKVHAAGPKGKASHSSVTVLARRERESLVDVRISTGRPHQIRIHMAACGHPLVGDPLYAVGGGFLPGPALPGDLGYLLHAAFLSLTHPASGRRLELSCPPPKELDFLV